MTGPWPKVEQGSQGHDGMEMQCKRSIVKSALLNRVSINLQMKPLAFDTFPVVGSPDAWWRISAAFTWPLPTLDTDLPAVSPLFLALSAGTAGKISLSPPHQQTFFHQNVIVEIC
jgi:hypothetical protein